MPKRLRPGAPDIEEMYEDTPTGHCAFCFDLIQPPKRLCCGDEICKQAYHRYYARLRKRRKKQYPQRGATHDKEIGSKQEGDITG